MYRASRGIGKSLARAVPLLAIGLAAGVTGGITVAGVFDTTPYDEVQFNTATRNAHEAGRAEGMQEANEASAQVLARLKNSQAAQADELNGQLTTSEKTIAKLERSLQESKDHAAGLQSSLAEKTAALSNATSDGSNGETVEGTLKTTWVLKRKDKPWPQGCSEPLKTYEVRVVAGRDATVAVARLVGAEAKRQERKGELRLTCSMTYSASLPTPLGSSYTFLVADAAAPNAALDSTTAPSTALSEGNGPVLTVVK